MGGSAIWDDVRDNENNQDGIFPRLTVFPPSNCSLKQSVGRWRMQPRLASPAEHPYAGSDDDEEDKSDSTHDGSRNESPVLRESAKKVNWNRRLRSVSIDSPESPMMMESSALTSDLSISGLDLVANIISPLNSPVLVKAPEATGGLSQPKQRLSQAQRAKRKCRQKCTKKNRIISAGTANDAEDAKKRSLKAVPVPKGKAMKKILRKKFSWKSYPEVSLRLVYYGDNAVVKLVFVDS